MLAESTSKFGAGLFLLVQVVLLLDFVHRWNDTWVGYDEQFWSVSAFLILLLFFFLSFVLSIFPWQHLHFFDWVSHCYFCCLVIPLIYLYRYVALLVVSLVCYLLTFAFSGLLFHWFTPSGQDCGLNTFFIVMTLIFVFVFAVVALHPAVSLHFL